VTIELQNVGDAQLCRDITAQIENWEMQIEVSNERAL